MADVIVETIYHISDDETDTVIVSRDESYEYSITQVTTAGARTGISMSQDCAREVWRALGVLLDKDVAL